MELNLSSGDAAFRDEVRGFIAENYPQEMRVPNPETELTKEQASDRAGFRAHVRKRNSCA